MAPKKSEFPKPTYAELKAYWRVFDQKHSIIGTSFLLTANLALTMKHIYVLDQKQILGWVLFSRIVLNLYLLYALWFHFTAGKTQGGAERVSTLNLASFMLCEWIFYFNLEKVQPDQWVPALFGAALCYLVLPIRYPLIAILAVSFSSLSYMLAQKENYLDVENNRLVFWGAHFVTHIICTGIVIGVYKLRSYAFSRIRTLEKKLVNKKKLLSVLVHDLRNPVSSQAQLSRLALLFWDSKEPREIKNLITKMGQSAEELLGLIENALHWNRVESNEIPVEKREVSLIQVWKEVENLVSLNLIAKNMKLQVPAIAPPINTDPVLLKSVLFNVVSNAIKYSPATSVIQVNHLENDDLIHIRIVDEGVGISDEMKRKLMEDRVQSSRGGTENEVGTGLGVRLAREFCQRLGGGLTLDNTKGKGLTVTISLPK